VKLVVRVKLMPTAEQVAALSATLRACNEAACRLSAQAYLLPAGPRRSRVGLQGLYYREVKERGLSAQPALHVLRKVADAYTTLAGNLKAGRFGPPGSARRRKAEGKAMVFRPDAARPFGDRCLSWQYDAGTVSIWNEER
jgi:putative transposase